MVKIVTSVFIFLTGFFPFGSRTGVNPERPNDAVSNLQIYLLIGQSNMAGRAEIEQQDKDTLENVFLFTGFLQA